MNTQTITLEIVSAEAYIFSGLIHNMTVSASLGELGIYPGHSPLLTSLKPGQIKAVLNTDERQIFYISGGMIEIQPHIVTVLADMATRAEDIDEMAAITAKEQAENAIKNRHSSLEYSKALIELTKALAQIRAIQTIRQNRRGT